MRVLGIETSCDETGIALYDDSLGLMADLLYSQIDVHKAYGGVVPELASRDHIRKCLPMIDQILAQTETKPDQIDAIAYTEGPGLIGALLLGPRIGKFVDGKPQAIPGHNMAIATLGCLILWIGSHLFKRLAPAARAKMGNGGKG